MTDRILYVESNPHTMELISRILKYLGGYRVIPARHAQSGIAIASSTSQRPDLILLGIKPDDASTLQGATQLRQSPALRGVPILAIIADDRIASHRQRIMAAQCDGCITQPASAQALLDIIGDYLSTPGTKQQASSKAAPHHEIHNNTMINLPIHDE